MPAPTDDCRSYSVSFDSLWYYTAMLYDYDHFSTLTLLTKIDRQPNQWRDVNFISRGHQVHTECICTWLSTGFFLRTIFAIEMNGKNRPSREFRPIPQNRLALKSYSYAYKFLRLGLAQGAISVLFSQNSSKLYFCSRNRFHPFLTLKSNFRWFGCPNPNFAL